VRRVPATEGVSKSARVDISTNSRADVDSAAADKSDEGYAVSAVNFC